MRMETIAMQKSRQWEDIRNVNGRKVEHTSEKCRQFEPHNLGKVSQRLQ